MTRAARPLLATLALLAACSGGSEATPTPEVTATATASPEATSIPPRPTPTPVTPVSVEGEYAIEGFELLVTSIPYDDRFPSDQFADRLDRVYLDWWGELQVDVLITAAELGAPIFRSQIVADPTGQQIVVAVCGRGDCGGFTPPEAGAMLALHGTTDGGRTWTPHGEVDAGSWLVGWHDGEVVLREPTEGDSSIETYRHHPSNRPFLVPADAVRNRAFTIDPASGAPLWLSRDGKALLDEAGERRYELPVPWVGAASGYTPLPNGSIYWSWTAPGGGSETIAAAFDSQARKLTPALEVPYGCCRLALPDGRPLVTEVPPLPEWIDAYRDELPTTQNGEPYAGRVPGALNPRNGAIHAITDPFLRAPYRDRDQIRVIAVVPPSPAGQPPPPSTSLDALDEVPGLAELVDAILTGPHAVIEQTNTVVGGCTARGVITNYCVKHALPADHTFDAIIVTGSLHCAGCNIAAEAVEAALARIYDNGAVETSAFWGGDDDSEDRNLAAPGVELVRSWEPSEAAKHRLTLLWPDRSATHVLGFQAIDPVTDGSATSGFLLYVNLEDDHPIVIVEPWQGPHVPELHGPWWTIYARP